VKPPLDPEFQLLLYGLPTFEVFGSGAAGLAFPIGARNAGFEHTAPPNHLRRDAIERYLQLAAPARVSLARVGSDINYGIRWEPFLPAQFKDGKIYNFSLDRFSRGIVSTVYPSAPPGFYYPGDSGVGTVVGPSFWRFDAALSRSFTVAESQRLELRVEAFNVLNGVRFLNPAPVVGSTQFFGSITAAEDPRIMQFAVKYMF
jgi:hypothetical protein